MKSNKRLLSLLAEAGQKVESDYYLLFEIFLRCEDENLAPALKRRCEQKLALWRKIEGIYMKYS